MRITIRKTPSTPSTQTPTTTTSTTSSSTIRDASINASVGRVPDPDSIVVADSTIATTTPVEDKVVGRLSKEVRRGTQEKEIISDQKNGRRWKLLISCSGYGGRQFLLSYYTQADQVYGDPEMHDQVRERCIKYMITERDHFSQFVTEDFDQYIQRKRKNGCFGNNLEIQAIGEIYSRPIEIYSCNQDGISVEPINIFHSQYTTDNAPIRLSYHNGNHYNAVVDPNNPSVGVGLGLPNLEPGLPDKMQMNEAVQLSNLTDIDEILLKQFTQESDMELAERQIEDAILAQSLLEAERSVLESSRQEFYQQMYNQWSTSHKN